MCVCTRFTEVTSADVLWRALCNVDFDLKTLVDETGRPVATAREAYVTWHRYRNSLGFQCGPSVEICACAPCPSSLAPLQLRVAGAWKTLDTFYGEQLPNCAATLRPPLTSEGWVALRDGLLESICNENEELELDDLQVLPGLSLLRLLLGCHDGQDKMLTTYNALEKMLSGCIGGYIAYSHHVSTRLLSSEDILSYHHEILPGGDQLYYVPVAINNCQLDKVLFLDLLTGDIFVHTKGHNFLPAIVTSRARAGQLLQSRPPDIPPEGQPEGQEVAAAEQTLGVVECDGMLRWLETLAERVSDGTYVVDPFSGDDDYSESAPSLCLFPRRPVPQTARQSSSDGPPPATFFTRSVTRGVEVCASVVFMPEQSQWTYSMRIRLLGPSGTACHLTSTSGGASIGDGRAGRGEREEGGGALSAAERGFETCQLLSRHWAITTSPHAGEGSGGGGRVEHVRGEGVVGKCFEKAATAPTGKQFESSPLRGSPRESGQRAPLFTSPAPGV